jgi:hypothetical protein
MKTSKLNKTHKSKTLTKAIVNEVIESVAITVVSKLVVSSRKFLETLKSYGIEIPTELSIVSKNHSSSRNKCVDQ